MFWVETTIYGLFYKIIKVILKIIANAILKNNRVDKSFRKKRFEIF